MITTAANEDAMHVPPNLRKKFAITDLREVSAQQVKLCKKTQSIAISSFLKRTTLQVLVYK